MFDGLLPEGLDIYVMTASEPNEDSWATYCGEGTPDDPCLVECPPPEFQGVCLGDLYSVAWMEDRYKQFFVTSFLLVNEQKVSRCILSILGFFPYDLVC